MGAVIAVRYVRERGVVTGFAVQLLVDHDGEQVPVRLYDNSHGELEMHRYNAEGKKMEATKLPSSRDSRTELPRIIDEIKSGYERMIRRD